MLIFSCLVKQYIYRFKGARQSRIKSVRQNLSATLLNCSPSSTTSLTSLDCLGPSTPTTSTEKMVNSQARCRWIIFVRKSSAFFSSSKPQNAVNDGLEICTYVKMECCTIVYSNIFQVFSTFPTVFQKLDSLYVLYTILYL